jgi:DNA-binding LacI/PurR family transcriptional regulator
MVSSLDVARRAGVSQSAVSRVFTPGASASPETRAKVLKAARALGYRPNVLARSLITGRSRIIGLVVAYLDNQLYPLVVEQLCSVLQARGYHVLVFIAPQAGAEVESVLGQILDYQVQGIVLASVAISSTLARRCDERGVPVVLLNRNLDDARFSAVTSDNMAGGRQLAAFLVAGGHQRIGYIAGWQDASTQRDREAGFRAGLEAADRKLFARDVGDYTYAGAQLATRRMFGAADVPDAVFVANDHMAFAAMDVLRHELGRRIPQDVSVVSYDDVPQAAWPSYALTSVRAPVAAMVGATVTALLARIEDQEAAPHRVVVPVEMIVRGSARIPDSWRHEGV